MEFIYCSMQLFSNLTYYSIHHKLLQEAYKLRIKMFDSKEKNLHVAIAEEDLAYALYVLEYSSGYFESAM